MPLFRAVLRDTSFYGSIGDATYQGFEVVDDTKGCEELK
jgi:hypothetical protein